MMDQDCIWKYAEYSTFYVESDSFKYKLNVTGYSGDAGTYSDFQIVFQFFFNEYVAPKVHVKLFYNTIIMTTRNHFDKID